MIKKKKIYNFLGSLLFSVLCTFLVTSLQVYGANYMTSDGANYITPSSSPEENYKNIQYCLDTYKVARLAPGTFNISQSLTLYDDSQLLSSEGNLTWPTIQLSEPSNNVINIEGNNFQISMLTINYNNQYISGNYPCKSTIQVSGSNNSINNCHVKGGDAPQIWNSTDENSIKTTTGIYIFGSDNDIFNNQIYNNTYGVIFSSGSNNQLNNCSVYYNRSDGITLVTYGKVINNSIHHNGFDCLNGNIKRKR